MVQFEGYERRIAQITALLTRHGIESLEAAEQICKDKGLNVGALVKEIQPIAFENACWAYTVGAAIAITKGQTVAYEIAQTGNTEHLRILREAGLVQGEIEGPRTRYCLDPGGLVALTVGLDHIARSRSSRSG